MKTPQSVLPDLATLTKWLTAGLDGPGGKGNAVKVLRLTGPRFISTIANEIVTCQCSGGRRHRVVMNTVLVRHQKLFPLDWQSAAIAPGEIDLARWDATQGDLFS
jgi:hypothetical protein